MAKIFGILSCLILAVCWFTLSGRDWIEEQIDHDLGAIPDHSISTLEIKRYFEELSQAGRQALYASIKNNQITWEETAHTDPLRNPPIFSYFEALSKKKRLPDMAFILLTDDGNNAPMRYPVLSFSCSGENNCPFPDFEMLWELRDKHKDWKRICKHFSKQFPWEMKKPQAFFRGAATGIMDVDKGPTFGNRRMQAMVLSHQFPDLLDAAFSEIFSPALQTAYEALGKTLEKAPIKTHFAYKWLLDIDGYANTYSRCRWILLSNSTLIKADSPLSQWYYRALQPWVHYVPVKEDLSDLSSTLQYLKDHDAIANQIAKNGQKWGRALFSEKKVDAYVYTLLSTYAKKLHE